VKTLILFSTRDGQTREIASYLASELKELGIQADVANVHRIEEPQWENYDRVVIGASIRYGHYHSAFQEFVKKHATRLNSMPSAFYSVNLVARKPEKRTPQTNSYACTLRITAAAGTELAGASSAGNVNEQRY
jgi:menaquinone-dependent protoporphyrinogen oxidase